MAIIGQLPMDPIGMLNDMQTKRFMKSHLPVNLLPNQLWTKNPKMVYVARNPKDTAVSYYHNYRGMQGFRGSAEDFYDGFLNGDILFGSYFHHVHEFLELNKLKKNFLFITYEEMQFDFMGVLEKMNKFLEKDYSVDQLRELAEYLKFDNMKTVPTANMSYAINLGHTLLNHNDGEKFE